MKHIRQGRKALHHVKGLLRRPHPWEWTGGVAFRRTKKQERIQKIASLLEDDSFRALASAIGFVEIHWALFESHMDRWVEVAYNVLKFRFGGKEAPISYSRKSAYLVEAFTQNTRLSTFRTRGLEILSAAKTLSVTRHDLTHGVITGIEPIDFFKFILENRKLNRSGRHSFKEVTFDAREFPQLSKDFSDLASKSIHLTSDLADRFL